MTVGRQLPLRVAVLLCLGFTGAGVAWADPARSPRHDWIEDPYAPHDTRGTTARLGSNVGFLEGELLPVTAVGLAGAVGQRFGRLAIEAEYAYLGFQARGPSSLPLGSGHRLGALGRVDVVRLGPRIVGGNSLLALYVEGGAAVAWNRWASTAYDEETRTLASDTKRVEGQVGFGVSIDHRLQEPIGFPRRIAWFLGWRLALAPPTPGPTYVCRGTACRPAPSPTTSEARYVDRSMLFQSSLAFTW